jgi:beta-carotene 3-hydroxylase
MSIGRVAAGVAAFVLMEPVTYATHRWVMHGIGERIHRSHHRLGSRGWEANDLYPLGFASIVIAAMAVGFNRDGAGGMVAVAVGISAYGLSYAAVHDIYIHRRLGRFVGRSAALDRLADAHELHHRFGGEPYGMLLPVVPRVVARRAVNDPSGRIPLA